jgi:hypothetical protein
VLVHAARLNHSAHVQNGIDDLADLEYVPTKGDDVADVQVVALVREVSDRLAVLVDELVVEDLRLHLTQSTAAR